MVFVIQCTVFLLKLVYFGRGSHVALGGVSAPQGRPGLGELWRGRPTTWPLLEASPPPEGKKSPSPREPLPRHTSRGLGEGAEEGGAPQAVQFPCGVFFLPVLLRYG